MNKNVFISLECEIVNNQHLKKKLVTCVTTKECKEIFKQLISYFLLSEDQAVSNIINDLKIKQSNNRNFSLGSTRFVVTHSSRAPKVGPSTRKKPFRWGK